MYADGNIVYDYKGDCEDYLYMKRKYNLAHHWLKKYNFQPAENLEELFA